MKSKTHMRTQNPNRSFSMTSTCSADNHGNGSTSAKNQRGDGNSEHTGSGG